MARYAIITKNSLKAKIDAVKSGVYTDTGTKCLTYSEILSVKDAIAPDLNLTVGKFITIDGAEQNYANNQLVQEASVDVELGLLGVVFIYGGHHFGSPFIDNIDIISNPSEFDDIDYNDEIIAVAAIKYVEPGQKVTRPSNPSTTIFDLGEDGKYIFNGWVQMELPHGDILGTFDFNTPITEDTLLVADWKEAFTVTFNSAGGSSVPAQTVVSGGKATRPSDPTRSGYIFNGWKLNGSMFNFNTAITENITLVADWSVYNPTYYYYRIKNNTTSAITVTFDNSYSRDIAANGTTSYNDMDDSWYALRVITNAGDGYHWEINRNEFSDYFRAVGNTSASNPAVFTVTKVADETGSGGNTGGGDTDTITSVYEVYDVVDITDGSKVEDGVVIGVKFKVKRTDYQNGSVVAVYKGNDGSGKVKSNISYYLTDWRSVMGTSTGSNYSDYYTLEWEADGSEWYRKMTIPISYALKNKSGSNWSLGGLTYRFTLLALDPNSTTQDSEEVSGTLSAPSSSGGGDTPTPTTYTYKFKNGGVTPIHLTANSTSYTIDPGDTETITNSLSSMSVSWYAENKCEVELSGLPSSIGSNGTTGRGTLTYWVLTSQISSTSPATTTISPGNTVNTLTPTYSVNNNVALTGHSGITTQNEVRTNATATSAGSVNFNYAVLANPNETNRTISLSTTGATCSDSWSATQAAKIVPSTTSGIQIVIDTTLGASSAGFCRTAGLEGFVNCPDGSYVWIAGNIPSGGSVSVYYYGNFGDASPRFIISDIGSTGASPTGSYDGYIPRITFPNGAELQISVQPTSDGTQSTCPL